MSGHTFARNAKKKIQKLKTDAEKGYQHNQISAEVTTGTKD